MEDNKIKEIRKTVDKGLYDAFDAMVEAIEEQEEQIISDAKAEAKRIIDAAKAGQDIGPKKPTPIANPKFDPKGKFEMEDKVKLVANASAPHHQDGDDWVCKGHQALVFLKTGYAYPDKIEVLEAAPKPKAATV